MKSFGLLRLAILMLVVMLLSCSSFASVISTATMEPTPFPTSTSSPTLPPPPTVLLEPKLYEIDVTQLNEAPQDILEQLYTLSTGAGGGGGPWESETPIWYNAYGGQIKPPFPGFLSWTALGFAEKPQPEALLTLPDGTVIRSEISFWDGQFSFSYEVAPGSLLGNYSVELVQGDKKIQDSVTLALPSEPVWESLQDSDWYAGFKPGEKISLHICKNVYINNENASSFSDITEFKTYIPDFMRFKGRVCQKKYIKIIMADEYGEFRVRIPADYTYSIEAELSGVNAGSKCSDTLQQRLKVGDLARVTNYGETLDFMTITWNSLPSSVPAGTEFKIVFGPLCGYFSGPEINYSAWVVETPDQTRLMVPESDDKGYFLEPVKP